MGQEHYKYCGIIAGYNEYVTIEKKYCKFRCGKNGIDKEKAGHKEITK